MTKPIYLIPVLALLALLSGCARTAAMTYGPDGKPAYYVDCSGNQTQATCFQKAGNVCKALGYHVVFQGMDKTEESRAGGWGGLGYGAGFGASSESTAHRGMVVQCGDGGVSTRDGSKSAVKRFLTGRGLAPRAQLS